MLVFCDGNKKGMALGKVFPHLLKWAKPNMLEPVLLKPDR